MAKPPAKTPAKSRAPQTIDATTHLQQNEHVTPVPFSMPGGVQFKATSVIRSGPIPSPQELLEYNHLDPTLANRIVAMAEREQAFRHNQEDLATRADIKHRDDVVAAQREAARGVFRADLAGQVMGWSVGVLCVCGAVYTALNGAHYAVSIALVSLPVASIIKAFRTNGKELSANQQGNKPTPARKRAPKVGSQ